MNLIGKVFNTYNQLANASILHFESEFLSIIVSIFSLNCFNIKYEFQ